MTKSDIDLDLPDGDMFQDVFMSEAKLERLDRSEIISQYSLLLRYHADVSEQLAIEQLRQQSHESMHQQLCIEGLVRALTEIATNDETHNHAKWAGKMVKTAKDALVKYGSCNKRQ